MPIQMTSDLRLSLDGVVERLAARYHGVFSEESVNVVVDSAWEQFSRQATLQHPFVPTLIERFARDQLRACAQADGLIIKAVPEVLFVCVRNAGRSQMAAAFAHRLGDGHVGVRSAGSDPGEVIHPTVIEAMTEIGLDVTEEFPKPLTDVVVRAADVVITMGCGDACPVYPGKRYQDWAVADPSDQSIETVRLIRSDIYKHVRELLVEMVPAGSIGELRAPYGSEP
jgi:protein-tyrosine-phosphatase